MTEGRAGAPRSEALLHPLVLTSLAVLVVNDHWAKRRWPGVVTGKLSDVVGLIFFPFVLVGLVEALRWLRRRPVPVSTRGVPIAALITGVAFSAVKSSTAIAAAYSDALGHLRWPLRAAFAVLRGAPVPDSSPITVLADPTDLVALVALIVPVLIDRHRDRASTPPDARVEEGSTGATGRDRPMREAST